MYTVDLHNYNQNRNDALYNLDRALDHIRKSKEHLVALIVGKGEKSGSTHIIRTYILDVLTEYKAQNKIKDFIEGNNIDIFNPIYHSFKGREYLTDDDKKNANKGIIIVCVR